MEAPNVRVIPQYHQNDGIVVVVRDDDFHAQSKVGYWFGFMFRWRVERAIASLVYTWCMAKAASGGGVA